VMSRAARWTVGSKHITMENQKHTRISRVRRAPRGVATDDAGKQSAPVMRLTRS
jgi:hypothetical protein